MPEETTAPQISQSFGPPQSPRGYRPWGVIVGLVMAVVGVIISVAAIKESGETESVLLGMAGALVLLLSVPLAKLAGHHPSTTEAIGDSVIQKPWLTWGRASIYVTSYVIIFNVLSDAEGIELRTSTGLLEGIGWGILLAIFFFFSVVVYFCHRARAKSGHEPYLPITTKLMIFSIVFYFVSGSAVVALKQYLDDLDTHRPLYTTEELAELDQRQKAFAKQAAEKQKAAEDSKMTRLTQTGYYYLKDGVSKIDKLTIGEDYYQEGINYDYLSIVFPSVDWGAGFPDMFQSIIKDARSPFGMPCYGSAHYEARAGCIKTNASFAGYPILKSAGEPGFGHGSYYYSYYLTDGKVTIYFNVTNEAQVQTIADRLLRISDDAQGRELVRKLP